MFGTGAVPGPRLLDPNSTAAVVFGAHDWTETGLGRAPSFLRSARGVVAHLYDPAGLGLDPELVLDFFDSAAGAGEQLAEIRDTLDTRLRERRDTERPVADLLVYYVGHGHTDDQGHLSLLVRRSRKGMEAETGIKAPDLARVLKVAAPQQRRVVVLDCCFSEAAARAFIGMSPSLDQAVAATAAKDLGDDRPRRGTLLLCSSPVGEVSMGPPNAARTLFTGAVLDVLREGAEGKPPALSFADLRDAAHGRMVASFGANAPRPVLHQVNAAQGDLTRTPAFLNRDHARREAEQREAKERESAERAERGKAEQRAAEEQARREAAERAEREKAESARQGAERKTYREDMEKTRRSTEERARRRAAEREAEEEARHEAERQQARREAEDEARRKEETFIASEPRRSTEDSFRLGQRRDREGNYAEAARHYRLAADQGHAPAQGNLGRYYEEGLGGLQRNGSEAARLYRLAAEQGHAPAQVDLGRFYEYGGGGLAKNLEEALRWYQRAAPAGEVFARKGLDLYGRMAEGGPLRSTTARRPPPTSPSSASSRTSKPASHDLKILGVAFAIIILSVVTFAVTTRRPPPAVAQPPAAGPAPTSQAVAPPRSPEENLQLGSQREREGAYVEAARLYRLAADQGHAGAQSNLGRLYEWGFGETAKDEREAARFYRLAASQGDGWAQAQLGRFYEMGRGGLPTNPGEAVRWYQRAAGAGQAFAQDRLNVLITNRQPPAPAPAASAAAPSRSPEEDFRLGQQREREGKDAEAARLYRSAADQGNAAAQYSLGQFYEQGWGGLAKDDAQAARLYRLAADQGNAGAQNSLGRFHEQGRGGLPKDFEEAVRSYQRAARAGLASAQNRLRALARAW